MGKLFGPFVGCIALLLVISCRASTITDISSSTPHEMQSPAIELQPSSSPYIPLTSPSQPLNTPNMPSHTPNQNETDRAKYSLDDLINEIKKQKGVFDISESPNKKYVAYMYSDTNSEYKPMKLHIWRVGDTSSQEALMQEQTVGGIIWSPNSDYVFVDTGTYVLRAGALYAAEGVKKVASLHYLHTIYFSPDGRSILYSMANTDNKIDTVKGHYLDPAEPFDLIIYDIAANQQEVILKGSVTEDYLAIGWLDSQTVSYDVIIYRVDNGDIQGQHVKYKYDLQSQTSTIDRKITK